MFYKIVLPATAFLMLLSCSPNDFSYFGQRVALKNDLPVSDTLKLEILPDYGYNTMTFALSGDMMISSNRNGDYHFVLSDIESGRYVGGLCHRGRGPGEMLSVMPNVSVNGNLMSALDMDSRYMEIDLESTVEEGKTCISTDVRFEAERSGYIPYANPHKLPGGRFLLYDFCYNTMTGSDDLVDVPYYAVYDTDTGKMERRIPLGGPKCQKNLEKHTFGRGIMFYPSDCVSEDGDKLAFALLDFPVYGFIDLQSGKKRIFRIKGMPDFDDGVLRRHFRCMCSDGNNLYAVYFGRTGKSEGSDSSYLYRMDWSGKLTGKYLLPDIYSGIQYSDGYLYFSKVSAGYLSKINIELL